jgi:predicted Zn-dependent protease
MHRQLYHLIAGALLWANLGLSHAVPHVPTQDAQVLEKLPFKATDPLAREMADLRAQWLREPKNPQIAAKLARRYYELVAEEGDPRYLGYAQAALQPWWEMPAPPDEIQVLRASLRQFRHDFAGALTDLDAIIARTPKQAQAHSLRGIIHIVQARYPQAQLDCTALREINPVANELIATGCESMIGGLTGGSAFAFERLKASLKDHPNASKSDQLWVLLRLAEISHRQARHAETEEIFKQALALGINDTFLYAAYSDFLLDWQRYAEILPLLKEKSRSDSLLLRTVLAENQLLAAGESKLNPKLNPKLTSNSTNNRNTLASRYAAAQMRGDTVHQAEEARFALHIEKQADKALKLAQEDWKVQREPRDARIFLEAAVAAKNPAAAQEVLQWLESSHVEDVYLRDLAKKLYVLVNTVKGNK